MCERNAAAAAADESEALDVRLDRNAWAAADAAEVLGAGLSYRMRSVPRPATA